MSLCLAERYSSMSVEDCLGLGERGHLSEDPLVDLPVLTGKGASFALPPGIQVLTRRERILIHLLPLITIEQV